MKVVLRQLLSVLPKLLKRLGKIFVCCILSAALVFCYSFRRPARASAGFSIAVEAVPLILAGLAALGIHFNAGMSNAQVTNFVTDGIMKDNQDLINRVHEVQATMIGGSLVYAVTKPFLTSLANAFNSKYAQYVQEKSVLPSKQYSGNWSYFDLALEQNFPSNGAKSDWNNALDNITGFTVLSPVFVSTAGWTLIHAPNTGKLTRDYYVKAVSLDKYKDSPIQNSVRVLDSVNVNPATNASAASEETDYAVSGSNRLFLGYWVASMGFDYAGRKAVCYSVMNLGVNGSSNQKAVNYSDVVIDGALPSAADEVIDRTRSIGADGVSVLNNSAADVIDRVGDAVGEKAADGTLSIPLIIPLGADKSIEVARDVTQTAVLGKDIATDADKAKDDTTNKEKDKTPNKPATIPDLSLPEVIFKTKFPFCIPWDFYNAFHGMVTAPTPPKWNYPFEVKSLGIKQNITIDFAQFEPIAAIIRWGLSIGFVILLIWGTRKLIGAGD